MATEGEERFLRSSHLLLKGTFYLAKKVLVREAENVRRHLDDLLKDKEVKLKNEFRNKRQREKLFPACGKTNVDDWDIPLLTGVLLIVFRESLPEEDRKAVKIIKYQRNEVFAHCAMASLDESDYSDTCKDLKDAFYMLASGCGSEVKQTCDAIIDTCLNGSLNHNSHVEHLKRLAEKDNFLLEILEKIETTGKKYTNDLKNTFEVENVALKRHITEDNSRLENNICDTIRNSKLTKEELKAVVLEALQQEKDWQQSKTIKVLDSQLDIFGKDEDKDNIALAENIIVTVTNEAIKRVQTPKEYTQIREVIQEILDEITNQSGVKPVCAIKGSVIIRFESCSYEQLSRLIMHMESTDTKDRLNKLADKLSLLISTKEKLQVSFSFSLKTLESILDEIDETSSQTDDDEEENNIENASDKRKTETALLPLRKKSSSLEGTIDAKESDDKMIADMQKQIDMLKYERHNLLETVKRHTDTELEWRCTYYDLQKTKRALDDKATENKVLQDCVDSLTKQIKDLQLQHDKLRFTLTMKEEGKVQQLYTSVLESQTTIASVERRLTTFQRRTLNSSTLDHILLQECLDTTSEALHEVKKLNHRFLDCVQNVQCELIEAEAFDGQVKQGHDVAK